MKKVYMLLIFLLLLPANSFADENKIRVSGDKFFPPYEYVDDQGVYRGFNVDILDAISLYSGFEVEYIPMDWEDAVKALEEGKIDVVLGMAKNMEREDKFSFSKPILINSRVIFVKKDNVLIHSLENLKERKISIQSGDISEEIVHKLQNVEIVRERNQEKALQDLLKGKVDAFIGNKYSGLYNIQKNKYNDVIKIVGEPVNSNEYCIAVNKDNKELIKLINEGLNKIKKNKLYDKIYYRWFGQTYTHSSSMMKEYMYSAAIIITILLFIIIINFLINRKLKKMVADKTKQIRNNMEEMNSLYEELYAQDEELQDQFRELKMSEEKIREANERLICLFINSPDAIVQFDKNHVILEINPAFEKLFGYKGEECIGKDLDDIITKKQKRDSAKNATKELFIKGNANLEDIRYTKEEKPIYVKIRAILMGVNEKIIGGYGIYTDITEVYENKEKLEYMSYHDNLTGLHNRGYFEDKIRNNFDTGDFPISIIMADLNGLKLVNDTMGHHEGDKLLIKLAKIMKGSIRSEDVLARIGGDEFVILMPNTSSHEADKISKRIKDNINKYNNNEAKEDFTINVSLGSATAEDESFDIREILKQADEIMYHDKLLNGFSVRSQILNVLLSALAEKDYVTQGHTKRVKDLCLRMGERLNLVDKEFSDLLLLAEMHDLGKVAIEDHILNKKGVLTEEEWIKMKQHCEKGYRIALSSPDLTSIADLILKHHERWDGKGYPLGLKKEEIPTLCRILSVVDAYDAMTSDRGYNKIKSKKEALTEIKNCAGKQFDPVMVEAFLDLFENTSMKHQFFYI